jgi:hypothetical protein
MKRFWSILTVCLLACTLGFAQDAPAERNLPQIQPAPCTVPAQIQGQAAVDEIIADIEEAGKYVQGVQGGCGSWDLTKKQRKNLGKLLLEDVRADQPQAECLLMNSSNEDIPFGTTATIGCSQTFELDETTSVVGHMVIGVRLDADGEVVVIFVAAGE